jgi:hypothetical protein
VYTAKILRENAVERWGLSRQGDCLSSEKTTIQITPQTRDRLFKLKFRRTYDQFLNELCDLYEQKERGE